MIRRVARIWKRGGGGYFERVRKVQTTLTRIFIVLESVSHGLSENSDEISRKARKFERFFRPKSGGLQKKKKVFAEIESNFLAEIRNSKVFFAPKQVVSKKKVFAEIESDFSAKFGNSNVSGGAVFLWGGAIFNFSQKISLKSIKKCDFEYFTSQWGGLEPPPPPLATLLVGTHYQNFDFTISSSCSSSYKKTD